MVTEDKSISTPEYWRRIYEGERKGATVDASDFKRAKDAFDRFAWVAQWAEGPTVIGVASGHARIEKLIQDAHPVWQVWASDQTTAALRAAKYTPYVICSAYNTPWEDLVADTVICTQAMEYMEDEQAFLYEARRIGKKLLLTVPIGSMKLWSQLRIYTEESVRELLAPFGAIEVFEREGDLLLVKLKFHTP